MTTPPVSQFRSVCRVSLVQFPLEGGYDVDSFVAKVERWLQDSLGADLIVFPELFTGDLLAPYSGAASSVSIFEERRQWAHFLDRDSERLRERLLKLAAEQAPDSTVVWGTIPRRVGAKVLNTAWISGPSGFVHFQDKLFLTPCEARAWSWQDGVELRPWNAPWGRTVVLICHDVEVPSISSLLTQVVPDVIIVPSCTGSMRGLSRVRWCSQARAVEHHAYVLQTSTVGPGAGTPNMNEHTGQAALIAPSEAGFEAFPSLGLLDSAQVLRGELNLELLHQSRSKSVVFPARDERARAPDQRVHLRGSE
jgi:predicted amidohydrolase